MSRTSEHLAALCDSSLAAATRAIDKEERIRHLEKALRFAQDSYRERVEDRVLDVIGH